jgi:hypothetical protein
MEVSEIACIVLALVFPIVSLLFGAIGFVWGILSKNIGFIHDLYGGSLLVISIERDMNVQLLGDELGLCMYFSQAGSIYFALRTRIHLIFTERFYITMRRYP